jgi:CRISPR-associated protein Csa3
LVRVLNTTVRTYIAPIGYNSTSVTRPVILSHGVEEGDRVVLLRPDGERDDRATEAIEDVEGLLREIEPDVALTVEEVPRAFEECVLACRDCLDAAEGRCVVSLGGGARDILLPFAVAVLTRGDRVDDVLFFSDLDGAVEEWSFPTLTANLSEPARETLATVVGTGETTLPELTEQAGSSKSTITRHVVELEANGTVESWREGKVKLVRPTLTGHLLVE